MALNPDGSPQCFPDAALWQDFCSHVPQSATFVRNQLSTIIEGPSAELELFRKVLMLLVLPDLLTSAKTESSSNWLREEFGLPPDTNNLNDFYAVISCLSQRANLASSIPVKKDSEKTVFAHVGQLRLPPRDSFIAPALTVVIQTVRLFFSRHGVPPLSGYYVETSSYQVKSEASPDDDTIPEDTPGELDTVFILNGESMIDGLALQAVALASALGNRKDLPPDLIPFLSAVLVKIEPRSDPGQALVEHHFHNIVKDSVTKRVTEWTHYDFLSQHCKLSAGDVHKGIQELNARLKDPSLKINLRTTKRLANLVDPVKTPPAFRLLVNNLRKYLDDDNEDLPFTKSMLNSHLFFVGSTLATRVTNWMKQMHLHTEESFMLTCKFIADDWLKECKSHNPAEGDNKWPKQPALIAFEQHRLHVSFFVNLLQSYWSRVSDAAFITEQLGTFEQNYASWYPSIKLARDTFLADSHTVAIDDDEARLGFIVKLSRHHFPVLDEYLGNKEKMDRMETDARDHAEKQKNIEQNTLHCTQCIEAELVETEAILKQYDALVNKMKESKQIATTEHSKEFEKAKAALMEHLRVTELPKQDQESKDRFSCLDMRIQDRSAQFRKYISQTTGKSEKDVYLLFNINFSLRRMTNAKMFAQKIGFALPSSMHEQDALLYRPVEWVSKQEDVDLLQRELKDALFGAPDRTRTPTFHKTELSLARTTLRKGGGQFTRNRVTATFARRTKGKSTTKDYIHADSWLENHQESELWGSEELWATTSMADLPLNEIGVWSETTEDYVSLSTAQKKSRVGSSGVAYDREIFERLCAGPLLEGKAVGIFDPCLMIGVST